MESKIINGYKIEFFNKLQFNNFISFKYDDGTNTVAMSQDRIEKVNNFIEIYKLSIYVGSVSDIQEELAEQIVDKTPQLQESYRLFDDYTGETLGCETAKESFETLSDLPYTIITKNQTNNTMERQRIIEILEKYCTHAMFDVYMFKKYKLIISPNNTVLVVPIDKADEMIMRGITDVIETEKELIKFLKKGKTKKNYKIQ